MKKIGIVLCILLCGIILTFSYISWQEKLAAAGKTPVQAVTSPTSEETAGETEEPADEVAAEIDIEALTSGMDPQVQELFNDRYEQGETLQMLVVGSESMEAGEPGYGELLKEAIETSYGSFVEIELMSFQGTSEEFLLSSPQLSDGYDVLLLEPFTLKNNGRVEIELEHEHIQEMFGEIQAATDDAVLILHPAQPIYGAQFYRTQVTALEEFAEIRDYAYIDHWEQWPSTEDITLKDYLTEVSDPNNRGAETWADALIAYFTGN